MSVRFTKKHLIIMPVIIIFILLSAYIVRHIYITPLIKAKEQTYSILEVEQKNISLLNEQLRGGKTSFEHDYFHLQKKLPVAALKDQFLLDIYRAEATSDSTILYIDFEDTIMESIEGLLGIEEVENNKRPEIDPDVIESVQSTEGLDIDTNPDMFNGSSESITSIKIDGLRQITATVFLAASDYESISRFLHEIERLPRIVMIDSIYITDPTGELYTYNDSINVLQFEVKISTFYLPTLDEIKDGIPTFDYESPGFKNNPLYGN